MIANRFWLLPLWVQGLVRAAIFALAVGAVVYVLYPTFIYRMGVLLSALSVIALCGIAMGATLYIQRPVRQRAVQALGGLDRPRSLTALEALRTGEVPSDPEVLAAAIRAGTLAQAYRRKTTRAQRAAQWCIPVVAITAGVVELFRLPPAFGGLLTGAGLLWVVQLVTNARRRRRTDESLQVLRAAADPGMPEAADVDASALPPLRYGLGIAAIVIPVIAFMTLVWFVSFSDRDCRVAGAAVNLIYDKRQLADPRNSEASLPAYRAWSQQLRSYADQVSDPRIAPRLRRIGDLSAQAVALVEHSRGADAGDSREDILPGPDKAFGATMQAIYTEDAAVAAVCFPHR
ncbi:hypothetical protein [Mycobacterium branderi]|uniref:Integral membrane protein n=1 Tax=Mycobacterium branderi TaxID=43348 RepID=A0A7I7WGU7_9MYCO|nr:hypothetical protein [Mycobacterium branderi]MCV7236276.1 hypothetical protein [Mycobacterium branderi]ORA35451.1 hypothetical protein BST20_17830 [Mycobacterium branderi]BBZ15158.1 hypothetical protein MBRA_53530 [Mycobacterium branderi]